MQHLYKKPPNEEDMKHYATVSLNMDSRGLVRVLIKKNIADAMKLKDAAEKKQRYMAVYDDKKKVLNIYPMGALDKLI